MVDIVAIVQYHVCLQEVVDFGRIAQMFNQGAHHPTVLVVLQALTTTIGEVRTCTCIMKMNVARCVYVHVS